jgi:ATP-dependent Lon protease
VVAHLFAQVEYLLPPTVLARKGSLPVSCNRDRLAIHYQPPRRHSERAAAVFDLITQTKHLLMVLHIQPPKPEQVRSIAQSI